MLLESAMLSTLVYLSLGSEVKLFLQDQGSLENGKRVRAAKIFEKWKEVVEISFKL